MWGASLSLGRYPSEFRVDDKPVEIVCDDRWPYAEVRAAVAERIGGGFAPADVGMAKKSYSMESTLDVPGEQLPRCRYGRSRRSARAWLVDLMGGGWWL